jgi:purine nucleosidase
MCDPLATAMVFQARPPRLTSVGLEVTTRCLLPAEECRRRFLAAGGPLAIVAEMAEVWFKDSPHITFHDPLAAALIFEPELCQYASGQVTVETRSTELAGLTHFRVVKADPPHRVATDVEPEAFFTHYFSVVGG